MTKAEKKQKDAVVSKGCIVCNRMGRFSPAEIHHLRQDAGAGMKSRKYIPLCPIHHRLGNHGVAIHAGQKTWEGLYGTELELWNMVGCPEEEREEKMPAAWECER